MPSRYLITLSGSKDHVVETVVFFCNVKEV